MALDEKHEKFRQRAQRALGEHQVAQAVTKYRAIIGPATIPMSEPLAQKAFDKLHDGEIPTADELAALEIVVRLLRPVVFTRNGVLDDLPDSTGHNLYPQELKDSWSNFRVLANGLVSSVGRVETKNRVHIGTGFLVAADLLATNRHVLGALTFGTEILASDAARVVFRQEVGGNNNATDEVWIRGVAAIHPTLDMVLLKVDPQPARPPLPIAAVAVADGERVAVLGYPGQDTINNPLFLAATFNNLFGVRRAALGEVLDGTQNPVLFHDASTTQGNSGSPILCLKTAKVAGIHRSGFFMYRNEGVDADNLGKFIAGLGS